MKHTKVIKFIRFRMHGTKFTDHDHVYIVDGGLWRIVVFSLPCSHEQLCRDTRQVGRTCRMSGPLTRVHPIAADPVTS